MSGLKQLNGTNGKTQMKLFGGERIYSIADTSQIVFLAQRARSYEDWIRLGRYLYRATKAQQARKPEFTNK